MNTSAPDSDAPNVKYQVLARKYRPASFDALIGQDAMVRTLSNAIQSGRLAHAFILTGVRGVGKTTTARIIARALNCIGADGNGGPTIEPCGVCEHCRAIAEDRHVDVIEMDAASRTGVDDIRELIEGVRYRPVSARYKVYIIDEVHMLSKNAFNALLKTLEEPPEHVKFIFATTETRKVPVTVLSRCQRFDLRRIDIETLSAHFAGIVEKENANVSPPALHLIARAADGSVRDGLSLLDQAIAHTAGEVGEEDIREMLGLADRTVTFDILAAVMQGDAARALTIAATQHESGAEGAQVLEDMLDLVHWLTRIKVTPEAATAVGVAEAERVRGREMADALGMAELARAWQILLKGLMETRSAPSPQQALEMILVRLAYAANLPSPADLVRTVQTSAQTGVQSGASPATPVPNASASGVSTGSAPGMAPSASATSPGAVHSPTHGPTHGPNMSASSGQPRAQTHGQTQAQTQSQAQAEPISMSELQLPNPLTFDEVVRLTEDHGEMILHANLISNVHLVHFEPGRIEYHAADHTPRDLAQRLIKFLNDHTSRRWMVSVSAEPGAPTLKQQVDAAVAEEKGQVAKTPLVRAVLDAFPGAVIQSVKKPSALPEVGASEDAPDSDLDNELDGDADVD